MYKIFLSTLGLLVLSSCGQRTIVVQTGPQTSLVYQNDSGIFNLKDGGLLPPLSDGGDTTDGSFVYDGGAPDASPIVNDSGVNDASINYIDSGQDASVFIDSGMVNDGGNYAPDASYLDAGIADAGLPFYWTEETPYYEDHNEYDWATCYYEEETYLMDCGCREPVELYGIIENTDCPVNTILQTTFPCYETCEEGLESWIKICLCHY